MAIVLLALIGAALLGRAYLPGVDVPSDSRGAVGARHGETQHLLESAETPNVPAEIPEQVIEAAPLETEEEEVPSRSYLTSAGAARARRSGAKRTLSSLAIRASRSFN